MAAKVPLELLSKLPVREAMAAVLFAAPWLSTQLTTLCARHLPGLFCFLALAPLARPGASRYNKSGKRQKPHALPAKAPFWGIKTAAQPEVIGLLFPAWNPLEQSAKNCVESTI